MSVTLHTTHGNLKIEVFCESVPRTAENFLALCASGYYNSSPFHRLIPSFILQTGCPAPHPPPITTPPTPAPLKLPPGASIHGEGVPLEDELRPSLRHNARGIVSMANKGPNTNGSQFFVLLDKENGKFLDGKNTVFGKVIGDESMETLAKLERLGIDKKNRVTERDGEGRWKGRIEGVTVHANPLAE